MWNGRQAIWRAGYLILVAGALYAAFVDKTYDDPYITYRYADNLAHGLGFVYNQGERVLSTTTPLFTLILAGIAQVTPDLPHAANLIGAFSLAGGALLIWELARDGNRPAVGYAGLVLYPAFPLLTTTLGSEMPLLILLCLGAFVLYRKKRLAGCAACVGLAVVARPDAILAAAVLLADTVVSWLQISRSGQVAASRTIAQNLRAVMPAVSLFLLITGAWFGFAWVYFGNPLPVTLMVKQAQGSMVSSELFLPGILTIWRDYLPDVFKWCALGFVILGLASVPGRDAKVPEIWLLLITWTGLYVATYALLGVTRYFWYYAPLVVLFVIAIGLGLDTAARLVNKLAAGQAPLFGRLVVVISVTGLGWAGVYPALQARQQNDQRVMVYRAIGEWLRGNTNSRATVATLEAGIIGFYAQRSLVDFAGLIRPDVARQFSPSTTYDDAAVWALDRYRPEYIVLRTGTMQRLEGWVLDHGCSPAKQFPGTSYSYIGDMIVYSCRP